jgi:hypothetical protein
MRIPFQINAYELNKFCLREPSFGPISVRFPGTVAKHGDLDVLVLMYQRAFVGCVVRARCYAGNP